jgi:hypothetical protein
MRDGTAYSTPGRRRSLRALAARKRANVRRVAAGKRPIVGGKQVSASSIGLTRAKAKKRLASRRKSK